MSEVVGEGVVRIRTDETGVDVDGAGKRAGAGFTKGFGSSLKGLAGVIGVTIAAAGAVDFLKDSVGEAREAQKVGAATTAIIKATGQAAGITADGIGDLASSLSAKTAVDDEQIQAGANLLLTFKNVKREGEGLNDVFGRATAAGLDLAAAGFGSVEGNAKQLGKALNDPLKGIAALSKSGVTFTDSQKAQIEGFVKSNDLLSAQKIILGEVEAQVGGTAEATATSGEKAAVAFGNIKEAVGTALLPVLDALANLFVEKIAPGIFSVIDAASGLGPVFSTIGNAISGLFSGLGGGGGPLASIQATLSSLGPVIVGVFQQALPVVQSVFAAIGTAAQTVLPILVDLFVGQVLPAVTSFVSYLAANLVPVFVQVAGIITGSVIPTIVTLATFIYGTLYPALLQIVTTVAENLRPVFDQLVVTFQTVVLPAVQAFIDQVRTQLIPALMPIISTVVSVIGFLASLAATILGVVLPPLIRFAGFILANVLPAVVNIITFIARLVGGLISLGGAIGSAVATFARFYASLVTGVAGAVSDVVSAISGLPGKVVGFVGRMVSAGGDLIRGLLDGMRNAASGVGGIISGVAEGVLNAVRNAINGVIDAFNAGIPNSLGAGPVSVDLPDNPIPHLQSGTRSAAGGYYTVGEVGPERVYLPTGAQVLTAAQTRQAGGDIDYAALAAALAAVLAPLLSGQRPVQFMLPSGDPEAAAMAAINRLVTA